MMGGLPRDLAWIGVHGNVVAIDIATGSERWRTRLKRTSSMVSLAADVDRLLAATAGEVFCLDATTGRILWRNRLAGLGLGVATVLTGSGPTTGAMPPDRGHP